MTYCCVYVFVHGLSRQIDDYGGDDEQENHYDASAFDELGCGVVAGSVGDDSGAINGEAVVGSDRASVEAVVGGHGCVLLLGRWYTLGGSLCWVPLLRSRAGGVFVVLFLP